MFNLPTVAVALLTDRPFSPSASSRLERVNIRETPTLVKQRDRRFVQA